MDGWSDGNDCKLFVRYVKRTRLSNKFKDEKRILDTIVVRYNAVCLMVPVSEFVVLQHSSYKRDRRV